MKQHVFKQLDNSGEVITFVTNDGLVSEWELRLVGRILMLELGLARFLMLEVELVSQSAKLQSRKSNYSGLHYRPKFVIDVSAYNSETDIRL